MRLTQTFGLAFLFVPNSTISYATLPRELNTDASSLYVMSRNILVSIGISLVTAMIRQRTQVHSAYLSMHLTPLDQPYDSLMARMEATLRSQHFGGNLAQIARGLIDQMLNAQAAFLAYIDVFEVAALVAFCMVPLVFLFRGTRARGGGGGAAAH